MKQITIDRFDGIYAICEDKDKAFFAIETSELPQGAKAGDVLKITDDGALSIDVEETERRRAIQQKFNEEHGIVPKTIVKQVRDIIEISAPASEVGAVLSKKKLDKTQRLQRIAILRKQMKEAATMLEFELAADLRDQIRELEAQN